MGNKATTIDQRLAGTNDIARNNGEIALKNILGNIISMCELAKANKIGRVGQISVRDLYPVDAEPSAVIL